MIIIFGVKSKRKKLRDLKGGLIRIGEALALIIRKI